MTTADRYAAPALECDLVMKGGVTSGIVYPPAVLELAPTYRFRSIGGTSAGAIAAAATAAAEYGRDSGGFTRLEAVKDLLASDGFLMGLFQASPRAQPLLDAALAGVDARKPFAAGGTLQRARIVAGIVLPLLRGGAGDSAEAGMWRGAGIGAVLGIAAGVLAAVGYRLGTGEWTGAWPVAAWTAGIGGLLLVLALGWAGRIAGAAGDLWGLFTGHVCGEQTFGLCTGSRYANDPRPQRPVLTDWLHQTVNELAGRTKDAAPLTFGELESAGVTLRMITTNLSQSIPFVLPFKDRPIFKEEEFARLFPEPVVAHLREKRHRSDSVALPKGYHYVPDAEEFPVVVAARMSLSFPVLISAVPLYFPCREAFARGKGAGGRIVITEADLQRHVFSDGGIASNFPIHFFDAWLPGRPTFGITLDTLPEAPRMEDGKMRIAPEYLSVARNVGGGVEGVKVPEEGDDDTLRDPVILPTANRLIYAPWTPVTNPFVFAGAIFTTAQNYRDTLQAMLPSYRERIVTVRLGKEEGGLNLAMGRETIAGVMEKGRTAGTLLRDDFRFDHHQWVRMRVLMAQVEENLRSLAATVASGVSVEDLAAEVEKAAGGAAPFPYPSDPAWRQRAVERMRELQEMAERWSERPVFTQKQPKPEPVLSVVPDV